MTANTEAKVILQDARFLSKYVAKESVDLVVTGPPYWNEVVYSHDPGQLSKINSYNEFLNEISKIWEQCAFSLKPGGVFCLWLHDFFKNIDGNLSYIPLHSDIIKTLPSDLILKQVVIWDRYLNKDRGLLEGRNLRSNFQYILILKKKGTHPRNEEKISKSLRFWYWNPVWRKKNDP